MGKITVAKVILLLLLLFTSFTLARAGESGISLSYGRLFWDEEVGLKGSGCLTGEFSHQVVYNLEIEGIFSYGDSKVRYKPTPFKDVNSWFLIGGMSYSWHHFKLFIPTISLGAGRLFFHKEGFDLEDYWVYQVKTGIRYKIKKRLGLLISYSHFLFRDEYQPDGSKEMRWRWLDNQGVGFGLRYTITLKQGKGR